MLCGVCNEITPKYKCSTCYCPYCSIDCWKSHKSENECKARQKVGETHAKVKSTESRYFTEDTVNPDKLYKLGESDEIKRLLKNRSLQNILLAVDNATNPENAVFEAMKNTEFVKFVDECLQIVEDVDI